MITVVTAPSRSGTSLTMQMLQAAGVRLYWDLLPNRTPINPFGHYEVMVKEYTEEFMAELLPKCEGKAVKIMPSGLDWLTSNHHYQFITILRNLGDISDSQKAMEKQGYNPTHDSKPEFVTRTQRRIINHIRPHAHCICLFSDLFNGVAQNHIGNFMSFDRLQIAKMNDCVDQSLWHHKGVPYL